MDEYRTVKQAIAYLQVSESTVRRMLKAGILSKEKRQNRVYIPLADLERIKRERTMTEHDIVNDRVVTESDIVMTQSRIERTISHDTRPLSQPLPVVSARTSELEPQQKSAVVKLALVTKFLKGLREGLSRLVHELDKLIEHIESDE